MKRNKSCTARRGKVVAISNEPVLPDSDLYRLLALIARRMVADSPTGAMHRGAGLIRPLGQRRGNS